MKIYAVADIHAKRRRLRQISTNIERLKPDILIVAGDLTNYRASSFVTNYLSDLKLPVFAIRGNTDRSIIGRQINNRSEIASGYLRPDPPCPFCFVGLDGTVPVPFRSRIALREIRALKKIAPIVNGTTILVVHPPPWGVLDEVLGKYHAGSKNLLAFVRQKKPVMVLCGHIHERPGVVQLGKSLIVNCTMGGGSQGALIKTSDSRPEGLTARILKT